jgi:hypothetical protein
MRVTIVNMHSVWCTAEKPHLEGEGKNLKEETLITYITPKKLPCIPCNSAPTASFPPNYVDTARVPADRGRTERVTDGPGPQPVPSRP